VPSRLPLRCPNHGTRVAPACDSRQSPLVTGGQQQQRDGLCSLNTWLGHPRVASEDQREATADERMIHPTDRDQGSELVPD
jgi:hypothetical protein